MKPIPFDESNLDLQPVLPDSQPLPVLFHQETTLGVGPEQQLGQIPAGPANFISCWELEPGDLELLNAGGKIWLHVQGPHPHVMLSTNKPFEIETENTEENENE